MKQETLKKIVELADGFEWGVHENTEVATVTYKHNRRVWRYVFTDDFYPRHATIRSYRYYLINNGPG